MALCLKCSTHWSWTAKLSTQSGEGTMHCLKRTDKYVRFLREYIQHDVDDLAPRKPRDRVLNRFSGIFTLSQMTSLFQWQPLRELHTQLP